MLAPDKRLGRLPPALHGRRVAFELPHPVFEIAVVARLREIRLAAHAFTFGDPRVQPIEDSVKKFHPSLRCVIDARAKPAPGAAASARSCRRPIHRRDQAIAVRFAHHHARTSAPGTARATNAAPLGPSAVAAGGCRARTRSTPPTSRAPELLALRAGSQPSHPLCSCCTQTR